MKRLRRSYIGICCFRVVFYRGVEPRCYIGICDADCLLRSSLLREVSCKTLVLEAWIVSFGDSVVENARFGSLDLSLLVKVSWKMLVLEAWIVAFGESVVENARFGSLDLSLLVKFSWKRSFWKLGFCHFW